MTQAHPTDDERRGLRVPCDFCEAPARKWCVSRTSMPRAMMHKRRIEEGYAALRETSAEADYRRAQEILTLALALATASEGAP